MISVEPSKIRLIRRSRSICSAGTARSPRAAQRVGGLVAAPAADLHQLVGHSPGHLAERTAWRAPPRSGCRCGPSSASAADRSSTASRAKVVAAMKAIFLRDGLVLADRAAPLHPLVATTRGRSSGDHLPAPAHIAGMRQPAGVERGQRDLEALALAADAGSRPGTRTSWNRVTPFSMPRRPMNALRRSTVMPGESASTTNAVMPPVLAVVRGHPRHDHEQVGDDAVGGPQLHAVEHVRRRRPRSASRWCASRAGSEPTSGSVSRKAVIAPAAQRGRNASLLLLGAEQLDRLRHADRLVRREQRAEARVDRADQHQRLAVVRHGSARGRRTPRGIFMPNAPSSASALTYSSGIARLALDARAVDRRRRRRSAGRGTRRRAAASAGSGRGCGWIRVRSNRPR